MSYTRDRAYGELFTPKIGRIVGGVYGDKFFTPASYELDVKQATDLIMMKGPNNLGVRIRGEKFLHHVDFTIRSHRDSGAETEFSKVMNGFMDWFFYAWGNGGPDRFPSEPKLLRWALIDMEQFRSVARNELSFNEQANHDGTYFYTFPFEEYGEALIASSEEPGLALGWPRVLSRAFWRLAKRNPDGVEVETLRSHFIYGLVYNSGMPQFSPQQWIKNFEQTLMPFVAGTMIIKDGTRLLAKPVAPKWKAAPAKTSVKIPSLSGHCRVCGLILDWPLPVGVIYADGTAECMRCLDGEVGSSVMKVEDIERAQELAKMRNSALKIRPSLMGAKPYSVTINASHGVYGGVEVSSGCGLSNAALGRIQALMLVELDQGIDACSRGLEKLGVDLPPSDTGLKVVK